MPTPTVALPYLALLAALYAVLTVRVIAVRRARGIAFGNGGQPDLERRVRVHANFAEYAPFSALLLIVAEAAGSQPVALHGLWTSLCLGRVAHALLVSFRRTDNLGRVIGMTGSFIAMLGAAGLLAAASAHALGLLEARP